MERRELAPSLRNVTHAADELATTIRPSHERVEYAEAHAHWIW